jgi:FAD/FMN-containing dehydrogenase
MAGDALIGALVSVVGQANVVVDADVQAGYETDWTGRFHGSARCVVRPASTDEVVAVLRVCSAVGAAVVPQGGNTGLVGGGVPRGGEVVLSLRRLHAMAPVDAQHGEVVVGAGAVLGAVRAGARAAGWDVGVDMASRDTATIGGMVSTNAGGVHVVRYGSMRNHVLGLEAVLADGTVVGRIPGLRKDNTGYDLTGLLTGSEGTLAVITRVHLALVAYLPDRVVALCALAGFADALTVGGELRKRLDSLVALEVFFADGLALVSEHTGLGLPFDRSYPAYLLVECAGRVGSAGLLVDELAGALGECPQVQATAVAVDAASRERLWAYRERHTEAINAAGIPHKLDVTLPFDQLVDFERAVRARLTEVAPRSRVVCFGHLGDGNLHVNILGPPPDDFEVDDAVLRLVAAMGGSISAEHGIGVAKRAALERSGRPADLAAMRAIKRALDPRGILNPGVLVASTGASSS